MAKVIGFYVPYGFHKRVKWMPAEQRGEVIEIEAIRKMTEPIVTSELPLDQHSSGLVEASKAAAMELKRGCFHLPRSCVWESIRPHSAR